MPNYEYECVNCGKKVEIVHSYQECDIRKERCPKCNSVMTRNIIFTGQVRVNGGTPKFYK